MVVTSSEVEDFPTCVGCIYYVNYECTNERKEDEKPLDLMDCYKGEDNKYDFMNRKFDRWWVGNLRVTV